jgi:hypothetical protein
MMENVLVRITLKLFSDSIQVTDGTRVLNVPNTPEAFVTVLDTIERAYSEVSHSVHAVLMSLDGEIIADVKELRAFAEQCVTENMVAMHSWEDDGGIVH